MPPARAPIVYTPSVERTSREFGHALVVSHYQDFINELVQRAIVAGIPRGAVRSFIAEIRGTLDHTANVLVGIGHPPNANIFDPSDTESANSDATHQPGNGSQNGTNGNANRDANGHTNGHENGHLNTANGHHANNSDSNASSWPNGSSSAFTSNSLSAVLQRQNGAQNQVNVNGHGAHAALVPNHDNTSTGNGLSTTLRAYDPRLILQSDDILDLLHIGRGSVLLLSTEASKKSFRVRRDHPIGPRQALLLSGTLPGCRLTSADRRLFAPVPDIVHKYNGNHSGWDLTQDLKTQGTSMFAQGKMLTHQISLYR